MSDVLRILDDIELVRCGNAASETSKASEVLSDKIVLIYFSAHWCSPCRNFTPVLAKLYQTLKAEGKSFELLFVSLDKDESEFRKYIADMLWFAVPFSEDKKRTELAETYKAEGIPHLVVLDVDGSIITDDAVSDVQSDREGNRFPWRIPIFEEIWPSFILSKDENGKETRTPSSSLNDKYLMLYFSAHWCPPCRQFTPVLSDSYINLKKRRADFETVFVSSDRDLKSFQEYFGEMTFCALPFEDRDAKAGLSKRYGVRGIPKLIMLGPVDDGGERPLINDNLRSVMEAGDFSEFPFPKKNYGDLEGGDDLNEKKILVVFNENGDDEDQEETREILKEVARQLKAEEDMSFYWSLEGGRMGERIKELTKVEASNGAAAIILDIPDGGGYYVCGGTDLTVKNLKDFVKTPGRRNQLGS